MCLLYKAGVTPGKIFAFETCFKQRTKCTAVYSCKFQRSKGGWTCFHQELVQSQANLDMSFWRQWDVP